MRFCIFLFTLGSMSTASGINFIKNIDSANLRTCNVGVMLRSNSEVVCEDQKGKSCEVDTEGCVCARKDHGAAIASLSLKDAQGSSVQRTISAQSGEKVSVVSQDESWNYEVTDLELNFSTEFYGSGYFLDFCYLGPNEQSGHAPGAGSGTPTDISQGSYFYKVAVTEDLSSNSKNNYFNDSGLMTQLQVVCDLRKIGMNILARGVHELSPQSSIEIDFNDLSQGSLSTGLAVFTSAINIQEDQVPRFCFLRILFQETNAGKRRFGTKSGSNIALDIMVDKGPL